MIDLKKFKIVIGDYGLWCGNLRGTYALDWALFSNSVYFIEFFFKKMWHFGSKLMIFPQYFRFCADKSMSHHQFWLLIFFQKTPSSILTKFSFRSCLAMLHTPKVWKFSFFCHNINEKSVINDVQRQSTRRVGELESWRVWEFKKIINILTKFRWNRAWERNVCG